MASISEEERSPSDTPTHWQGKAKRAQVKNACVNCQRACKKCDSGRPCQRCVKYNMADTCVDSKRKPRKKGIKRGPYKKRKKNTSQEEDTQNVASPTLSEAAVASTSTVPLPKPPPPTARRSASSRRPPRTTTTALSDRPHRPRPPQILGPGAIPILHTDPLQDENEDAEEAASSGSDTPLVHQRPIFQQPETPTMGLTAAFNTLATAHRHHHYHHRSPLPFSQSSHPVGGGSSNIATTTSTSNTLRYSQQPPSYRHALPPLPFSRGAGPIRLPPIESFDHAQALSSPPQASSLAMLTDVALGRTSRPSTSLHGQQHIPPPPPSIHTIPPIPHPLPPQQQQGRPRSASDIEQQSYLDIPEDPQTSRYTTSAESDMSSVPSSFDSRQSIFSNDKTSRARIRRLSRRLHNTHLEQEYADIEQSDSAHSC
ncbi:hypothetical protein IW140_005540 [Coemansia sp. RSA 1813]|nr:hypothetical protein EV178_005529 [Coemansia sp. RSA 1646]KAJ1765382.1 hypothetical protein LPJ74_006371 [Coemansia sp. RSA 1843]KAJ2086797.1 hypothetical protein IW138_005424 [Coemansia sp. RSA 986]KAJ2211386.1 hypothetical protein EV179_005523 [Coemansia sp. RSA 487]KAJ2564958.1 hypothetical protein IW140_005540 [Coemansia sp. RSA 1813]